MDSKNTSVLKKFSHQIDWHYFYLSPTIIVHTKKTISMLKEIVFLQNVSYVKHNVY